MKWLKSILKDFFAETRDVLPLNLKPMESIVSSIWAF